MGVRRAGFGVRGWSCWGWALGAGVTHGVVLPVAGLLPQFAVVDVGRNDFLKSSLPVLRLVDRVGITSYEIESK